jgi:hypothetical protein
LHQLLKAVLKVDEALNLQTQQQQQQQSNLLSAVVGSSNVQMCK